MAGPLLQSIRVGAYVLKETLKGNKHYPLALMLEPLFRCNLECPGCGKIDYPKSILDKRMSAEECWHAADECGAPVVCIPGGEPLIHKEIGEIVEGLVARKKFVYVCTNALLLKKKLHLFKPSPYLAFAVHLDGLREEHDEAVAQDGVFDAAILAIKEAISQGFRINVNCTLYNNVLPERAAEFFNFIMSLGAETITLAPGYAYERAPAQDMFLGRKRTKQLFREIFRLGKGRGWRFNQSSLYLDFLAGNQDYRCTPWGNPTRNVFGWQKPCYMLAEGYAKTFKELIETTDWDLYGTGKYEKCANCMMHSGYEASAVKDATRNPFKSAWVALRGPRTDGPMAPEIDLSEQRPAVYMFERQVADFMTDLDDDKAGKDKVRNAS
jgi:hopanoid biosynthesis associated radical SAM protein HpnH